MLRPPPQLRKLLELLLYGRLGRNKVRLDLGGTFPLLPPLKNLPTFLSKSCLGWTSPRKSLLTLQVNIPGLTPLGSGVAKSLTL